MSRTTYRYGFIFVAAICLLVAVGVCADWKDHEDIPEWLYRGRSVDGCCDELSSVNEEYISAMKDAGCTRLYCGTTPLIQREKALYMQKVGLPLIVRVEGIMFFEDYDNLYAYQINTFGRPNPEKLDYTAYHGYPHNCNWFEKYPESPLGVNIRRDGTRMIEYLGSVHALERTAGAVLNPYFMKQRELFLTPFITGESALPGPIPECCGLVAGFQYDNPHSNPSSYDVWTTSKWREHFKKKFDRAIFDPPTDPYPPVRRAWERYWLDAYAEYYRTQKGWLRTKGKRPMCQSTGLGMQRPWAVLDYYAFHEGAFDYLRSEEAPVSTHRFVFGYKAGLAVSHGKCVSHDAHRESGVLPRAEAMACLGDLMVRHEQVKEPRYVELLSFWRRFPEIYYLAGQGGKAAVLFHLEYCMVNSQIQKLLDLTDQLCRIGVPFEVITEDDLKQNLMERYNAVIIPGIEISADQVGILVEYARQGGNLLFIGDNHTMTFPPYEGHEKEYQADNLGPYEEKCVLEYFGKPPWQDIQFEYGKGKVAFYEAQVIPDSQLVEGVTYVNGLGYRLEGCDEFLFFNALSQPRHKLRSLHLVNYGGEIRKNLAVRFPCEEKEYACLLSPDGIAEELRIERVGKSGTVTVPRLALYDVIVISGDSNLIKTLITRQTDSWKVRKPELEPGPKAKTCAPATPIETLGQDKGLCRYRAGSYLARRVFFADFVYPKQVKTGGQAEIGVKIVLEPGWPWDTEWTWVEFPEILFRNTADGSFEKAEIDFPKVTPMNYPQLAGFSLKDKDFRATWTPKKAGRYQAYFVYRYTNEMMEGQPDFRDRKVGRRQLNYYFMGEPREKITYTDRLERMVIDVQ